LLSPVSHVVCSLSTQHRASAPVRHRGYPQLLAVRTVAVHSSHRVGKAATLSYELRGGRSITTMKQPRASPLAVGMGTPRGMLRVGGLSGGQCAVSGTVRVLLTHLENAGEGRRDHPRQFGHYRPGRAARAYEVEPRKRTRSCARLRRAGAVPGPASPVSNHNLTPGGLDRFTADVEPISATLDAAVRVDPTTSEPTATLHREIWRPEGAQRILHPASENSA
jgi:hypothetical protein